MNRIVNGKKRTNKLSHEDISEYLNQEYTSLSRMLKRHLNSPSNSQKFETTLKDIIYLY